MILKFRAWDKEEKRFYYSNDDLGNFFSSFSDLQIDQYTGLEDKDGKEIYNGDIFHMGVVIFSRGCFNGCYTSSSTNERGWDYSDEWEDGLYSYAKNYKVEGNIHENPERFKII